MEENQLGLRIDNYQSVGLSHLRGNLRQVLGSSHANRDWQADLSSHSMAYCRCDLSRRTEEMSAPCDISEGLIDRDSLDERREIIEHIDDGIAQPLVLLEMTTHEYQLRTEFACTPSRHATADSERLGFV